MEQLSDHNFFPLWPCPEAVRRGECSLRDEAEMGDVRGRWAGWDFGESMDFSEVRTTINESRQRRTQL